MIIGLIKGEVIKKEIQTPSGIFALKKAFNKGMLEQVQNGVKLPKNIAFI